MVDQGQTIIRETSKPILPRSLVLASCFEGFKGKFNFLSIDAEGWYEVVLRSNDWVKFRPKLILVERNNDVVASDIDTYLVSNNYTLLHAEACNALYEDKLKS